MIVQTSVDGLRAWKKNRAIKSPWIRVLILLVIIAYFILASQSVEINFERIRLGLSRIGTMFNGFLRPDFLSRGKYIADGVLESVAMTIVASSICLFLAVPLSLGASRNIGPLPIYLVCRVILMIVRSLHVVVIGIIFVIMLGFGPLAGVLTLMLNSVGFIGKLLAEDIENIDKEPLEAIRATGASWLQVVVYGVWPQISTRFIGLAIYRADINFRQSTILGIVGAGGIGGVLDTAMGRYDYRTAGAILLVIIAMVLVAEYISSHIRRRIV